MGFDRYSKNKPLVDVHKADTKTNIWVIVGVVVFAAIATTIMFYYMRTPAETRYEVHQDSLPEAGE